MCFAQQGRALFRHVNFQKPSDTDLLCTFWLGNVLHATMARTFSSSQLPKMVWDRQFFTLLAFDFEVCFAPQRPALDHHLNFQKCSEREWCALCVLILNALRATKACKFSSLIWPHGSAPAALASLFSTPRGHKSSEKHSLSRLFHFFPHLRLLSSDSFSSLMFFLLLFSSLTLPTSAFPSVHIFGSLTSKPSVMTLESRICVNWRRQMRKLVCVWRYVKDGHGVRCTQSHFIHLYQPALSLRSPTLNLLKAPWGVAFQQAILLDDQHAIGPQGTSKPLQHSQQVSIGQVQQHPLDPNEIIPQLTKMGCTEDSLRHL